METKGYLGDGVYIDVDESFPSRYTLTTNNGIEDINTIHINREIIERLNAYIADLTAEANQMIMTEKQLEEAIIQVPQLARGRVWCLTCGATIHVDSASCLRKGWPKCCGYTMTIDSPEERKAMENDGEAE
jgi:hydrogenase maturation factor HypF (carbamoyltransferase family)